MIDVGSEESPKLSNFTERHFIFRNVPCASMEGLLQSLKFPIIEKQNKVAGMVGIKAKRKGQKKKWWLDHKLYWQGKEIDRFSEEYKSLIEEAFSEMFKQCPCFRNDLKETGQEVLIHSIGKNKENFTILTEDEFCSILMKLRNSL